MSKQEAKSERSQSYDDARYWEARWNVRGLAKSIAKKVTAKNESNFISQTSKVTDSA